MTQHQLIKQTIRAVAAGMATLISGLLIYEQPPGSWDELLRWVWQPGLQGVLVTLGALGVNIATQQRR